MTMNMKIVFLDFHPMAAQTGRQKFHRRKSRQ
jgi:hypothetical protein